ncbi:multiheme c-type cytochrome [Thalassoglobus polymorphus]|uniref:Cytochrome c-552/4 domain-containing protein n=1 Tax=Thalassoglobus polymorphus TaxID=2527994 RepID=A0A517QIA6_9PLAN|nr:multiheme c-type cytochrome [Thalassoglobus polymorphus]QDT31297.1 hypothetical protein Mal48_05300 [Thalassoglobus polymorphus]
MQNDSEKRLKSDSVLWLLPMLILVGGLASLAVSRTDSPEDRPRPVVLSSQPRVSQERCAECHSDITDEFHLAPHSRTLKRVPPDEFIEKFAGRSVKLQGTGVEMEYRVEDDRLAVSSSAYPRELPIEWIFGSGTHACTPLITWTDAHGKTTSLEHSVSWYPDGKLARTLGMEELKETEGLLALGVPRTPAQTVNCFGCHATHVPVHQGKIDFDGIEPGIGCIRCHKGTAEHVRNMDEGFAATIERFSQLSPREAVDRCGECHRRADELDGEIRPDDKTLPRFASVGLVQSPCFKQQAGMKLPSGKPARLDCTTCHDPHRPAIRDWKVHTAVCLDCHHSNNEAAHDCPRAARDSNCLKCHMPKVPANEHLEFTDHWIRIQENFDSDSVDD